MINWDQLKNFGLSREYLQERGLLVTILIVLLLVVSFNDGLLGLIFLCHFF